MNWLLVDMGGTNTRCAVGAGNGEIVQLRSMRNQDFASAGELLSRYLEGIPVPERPASGAIAVAAPVAGDAVQMINIGWNFSVSGLQQTLGLTKLAVVNDFVAQAWALPSLRATDTAQIGSGQTRPAFPKVVLGPGTGLGVATMVPVGDGWQAIPGEGGHISLAAQDAVEESVVRLGRERFGHCSAERALSGPGLSFLHNALHGGPESTPAAIGQAALAGDRNAVATFAVFFGLLGSVAGDLALTLGAFGGVYVSGGIVPRYLQLLRDSEFRDRFEAKGRYREYLSAIPTFVVTAPYAALQGLLTFLQAAPRG